LAEENNVFDRLPLKITAHTVGIADDNFKDEKSDYEFAVTDGCQ